MPVLPEFMPEGRPGEAADNFAQGRTEGESWMTMEQNRQIAAQQEQERQQAAIDEHNKMIAMLPAIHAQAQANVVSANAQVALTTQQQQLIAKSAIVAPSAQNEFLDALQYADPQTQFDELGKLQAKYNWLKLNPQYQPMIDAIDKARGDAFHMLTANNLADATLQRTEALVGGRTDVASIQVQQRQQAAEAARQARITAAQIMAEGRESAASMMAGSRVQSATISAQSRTNKLAGDLKSLQAGQDAENQAAQEAIDNNDPELAKLHLRRAQEFQDAATKASTYAGNAPTEPQTAPPPSAKKKPAPVDNSPPAEVHFTPPEGLATSETKSSEPKLYTPPSQPGQTPTFTPAVKTAPDVLKAMQQMVNDGVITPDQARETLKKLGFKPKQ